MHVKRATYIYAAAMAGLLFLLKTVEYRYLVYDLGTEYLVGFIALVFTLLGLWIGWKLTAKARTQIETVAAIGPTMSASELGISPREEQVLKLIAAGHSNQEIADELFLSLNTIKKHTSTLFRKLGASRRTQAIEKARKMGLIR
jgi:two-component system, NarL family, response regulator LiaR